MSNHEKAEILVFELVATDDTAHAPAGREIAFGAVLPSGTTMIEWDQTVFDEDARINGNHISQYESFDDVGIATSGEIRLVEAVSWS